jgi:hypothetical protein
VRLRGFVAALILITAHAATAYTIEAIQSPIQVGAEPYTTDFGYSTDSMFAYASASSDGSATQYTRLLSLFLRPSDGDLFVHLPVAVTFEISHSGNGTGCSSLYVRTGSSLAPIFEDCDLATTSSRTVTLLTNTEYRLETNAQAIARGSPLVEKRTEVSFALPESGPSELLALSGLVMGLIARSGRLRRGRARRVVEAKVAARHGVSAENSPMKSIARLGASGCLVALVLLFATGLSASPITWTFSGNGSMSTISTSSWVGLTGSVPAQLSTPFTWTISISVDSAAPDLDPSLDGRHGRYDAVGGTFSFAGLDYSFTGGSVDIFNEPTFDGFYINTASALFTGPTLNGKTIRGFLLQPIDGSATVFSSDALPATGPGVASFSNLANPSSVGFFFNTGIGSGNFSAFGGALTSIARTPLPEPHAALLAAGGSAGLAWLRRRGARRP